MDEESGIQDMSPDEKTVAESSEQGGVNYHDRIQAEPEFAVEEVRKKDSYIGKLNEKMSKFKPLEQYVEVAGGEEIARLAGIGHQIESNPQLKQALQDAINGKPAQAQAEDDDDDDEIFDPEIKAIRNRYDAKIEELSTQNRDLMSRLNQTEAKSFRGSMEENMATALTVFKDDDELFAEAQSEITRAVDSLETAAKNGDRAAAKQLDDLGRKNGARTLRMMTIDIYDRLVERKLERNTNLPNGEAIRKKATDTPATTRSSMPSDSIVVEPGRKVNSALVREVMEAATRKLGKDPNTLFR